MVDRCLRRQFLRLGSVAALTATAGCGEQSGDGVTTRQPSSRNATPSTTTARTDTTTATPVGPETFVRVDGTQFTLDGDPWYFNGAQYDFFPFTDDRAVVDEVLEDAADLNVTVLRTHAGCSGRGPAVGAIEPYVLQPEPGELNESAFRLLDRAIARSRKHGIRWILWLANNWKLFGNGIAQYVNWATDEPIPDGGSLASDEPSSSGAFGEYHDRFYTNEEAKQLYKQYVRRVLTRTNTVTGVEYRNDPSILVWELLNEGKAMAENRAAFHDWHAEMAGFVSDLAPNQLVATGGLGYYADRPAWADSEDQEWLDGQTRTGMDYVEENSIDDIDACSFHTYPGRYHGHWEFTAQQTRQWIEGHVADAHDRVGKPAYNGEWGYGIQREASNSDEQLRHRNQLYERYFQWFDEVDLDGSVVYHLWPGEPRPVRTDLAIFSPGDERTCELITNYGDTVADKSGAGTR